MIPEWLQLSAKAGGFLRTKEVMQVLGFSAKSKAVFRAKVNTGLIPPHDQEIKNATGTMVHLWSSRNILKHLQSGGHVCQR